MAKDPWHKDRINKIKNSPAAGKIKKAGKAVSSYLGLDDESLTRNDHFEHGSTEHITEPLKEPMHVLAKDATQAQGLIDNGAPAPFAEDNVSSITNAFAHRVRKAPPEGY